LGSAFSHHDPLRPVSNIERFVECCHRLLTTTLGGKVQQLEASGIKVEALVHSSPEEVREMIIGEQAIHPPGSPGWREWREIKRFGFVV